ncbi:MAG: prenyltransferase/squalene oxidase repeat-containing protein [Planctomycetota bacterium]|jgi:squalene-hopene/tetraprenyl-beta-curcumene cyclase
MLRKFPNRTFNTLLCLTLPALTLAGCARARQTRIDRIDDSLTAAVEYLMTRQSDDGAWRSETYGCFRGGPTLTPYIMSCLLFLPQGGERMQSAFRKGAHYVMDMVDENGNIRAGEHGLNFPVYTAASASRVVVLLDKAEEHKEAQAAWLDFLRARRLSSSLGWEPSDVDYGGWGFALDIPRKPEPGQLKCAFCESNLTATIFGIGALRSAKVPSQDPIWKDILIFVKKCQNFHDDPANSDERFDDGGFFFRPGDALENKAGIAGTDRFGRERFSSYGSMTADGLRALLGCGLDPDHPRVVAARKWLEKNFTVETNPGNFAEDREVLRGATYYYYLWSFAHAFTRLGIRYVPGKSGPVNWAEVLAEKVMELQRPDGSWVNRFTDAKEDDPLVSTPWAAAALASCRYVLTTEGDLATEGCPRVSR